MHSNGEPKALGVMIHIYRRIDENLYEDIPFPIGITKKIQDLCEETMGCLHTRSKMASQNISEIKRIIQKWAEKYSLIRRIYIFGSRARDDFNEKSDLDIAIEFFNCPRDESLWVTGFFETPKLRNKLQKLLSNYKVQLEHFHPIRTPHIKMGVERSSILIYESEQKQ